MLRAMKKQVISTVLSVTKQKYLCSVGVSVFSMLKNRFSMIKVLLFYNFKHNNMLTQKCNFREKRMFLYYNFNINMRTAHKNHNDIYFDKGKWYVDFIFNCLILNKIKENYYNLHTRNSSLTYAKINTLIFRGL